MQKFRVVAAFGVLVAFAPVAIAQHASDGKDRQLLSELVHKWVDAYNRQDAATVAATFSPEAIGIHADAINRGREAIQKYYNGKLMDGFHDLTISIDTVRSAGDVVYSTGEWTVKLKGQAVHGYWSGVDAHEGNALTIQQRTSVRVQP